jgi:hypothetical protein
MGYKLGRHSPYLTLLGSMVLKICVRMYQPELIIIELKQSLSLLGMIRFSFSIVTWYAVLHAALSPSTIRNVEDSDIDGKMQLECPRWYARNESQCRRPTCHDLGLDRN